jgi:ABC-type uncharacterized transport system permease subunit
MSGILPYIINAMLYAALAGYFWRRHWTRSDGETATHTSFNSVEHYMVAVPLILHATLVSQSVFADDGLHLGIGNAISTILMLSVMIYWLGNFFYKLDGLQLLVLPVAALACLLPVVFPPSAPLSNTAFTAFKIHLLIAILAYSLFTIAALHVLLMALLERQLHGGSMPMVLQKMPPLLTLEALLFRIIWTGFVLLTLTLVSGVVFSEELFGRAVRFNHKTVFGVLSWLIFAALLGGRHIYGWRGRVAVRWTLAGFLTLVLAYIGSKFVLEIILGRT